MTRPSLFRLLFTTALARAADPFTSSLDQAVPCDSRDPYAAAWQSGTLAGWPVGANATPAIADALAALAAGLDGRRAALRAPSAALVVAQGGRVALEAYAGHVFANGTGAAPDRESGYRVASNTKIFTSVMLYQLRDRGALPAGLDTPVAALLPGFVEPQTPARYGERPTTLRALAMHASGFVRDLSAPDLAAALAALGGSARLHPLFAAAQYSNVAISVLGRALESAANCTWEEWVAREIVAPLGLARTGSDYGACAAYLVEGVDPATQRRAPTPPPRAPAAWDAPCGAMFSTPRDMVTWGAWLGGADADPWTGAPLPAAVLDRATRLEMQHAGFSQPDAISAVGAGTFERAFMRGRWTHNKLGCVDGYRSALTLVPSLGLTIFGAAASTCDLLGDGDALTLPAAAALAAPLGEYLVLADARARADAGRALDARVTGSYCAGAPATAARVSREPDGRLVLRPAGAALTDDSGYSFELAFEANETAAGPARFRMLMTGDAGASDGVAWLDADARPGCRAADGANLCPISCPREMARGGQEFAWFNWTGGETRLEIPSASVSCARDAAA